MVTGFERIVVSVPDLGSAIAEYEQLMGVRAFLTMAGDAAELAWFDLGNTVIQIQQGAVSEAAITGLVFSVEPSQESSRIAGDRLGLDLDFSDGSLPADLDQAGPVPAMRVDHLVLRTTDADACIALFETQLGIRLALDKTVPEWGGRMLFFRAGKLTLEVIASDKVEKSAFWGIAYQCPDLETAAEVLSARGVALTEVREGRKPGTRVATVKSHCLGLPTLLIEPAAT
jgi:catechol 2,3-dioxygenase-like lactoylglutathione lyase family enzyme